MASWAAYDNKRLLVKLSDKLTREDSEKIVYLQNLPKKLEGKSPLKVLTQLEARGKTIEDIIEILKDINRHDVAREAEELHMLGRRQDSPSDGKYSRLEAEGDPASAVKLEDHLEHQLEHLLLKEMISGAKAYLKDRMCSVLKDMSRQSHTPSPAPLPTQSQTNGSKWETRLSQQSKAAHNNCSQKSVAVECAKSPLLTRGKCR